MRVIDGKLREKSELQHVKLGELKGALQRIQKLRLRCKTDQQNISCLELSELSCWPLARCLAIPNAGV